MTKSKDTNTKIVIDCSSSKGLLISLGLLLIILILFVWLDLHPHIEKTISGTGKIVDITINGISLDEFYRQFQYYAFEYKFEDYICKTLICEGNLKIYNNFEGCEIHFSEAKEGDKCVYLDKKVQYKFKWR